MQKGTTLCVRGTPISGGGGGVVVQKVVAQPTNDGRVNTNNSHTYFLEIVAILQRYIVFSVSERAAIGGGTRLYQD